jgi:hypothetical protein
MKALNKLLMLLAGLQMLLHVYWSIAGVDREDGRILAVGVFGSIANAVCFLLLLSERVWVQVICCVWQILWPLFLISIGFLNRLLVGEEIAFLVNTAIATIGSLLIWCTIKFDDYAEEDLF